MSRMIQQTIERYLVPINNNSNNSANICVNTAANTNKNFKMDTTNDEKVYYQTQITRYFKPIK